MKTITAHAYARAGLVGNPSDGYFGKTISFIIRNFSATVSVCSSQSLKIIPDSDPGGMRLIEAVIKRFVEHCRQSNLSLRNEHVTVDYRSDIPREVGLAGSSGIVIATLRALTAFHGIKIPPHALAELALSVERDELKIAAGLQDRVVQCYEGIVYMDFDRGLMASRGYGEYVPLQPAKMPRLYVAYDSSRSEPSNVPHSNLRQRFERGDRDVIDAMQQFRDLTDHGRDALMSGDWPGLHRVINANYDLRQTIMPIAPGHHRMIEMARSTGVSAKFAGSGGAICGMFEDDAHYARLAAALSSIGCTTLQPRIFE
jgi:glucuronokinase